MSLDLNSPIWDDAQEQQIVSNMLTRIAKGFKQREISLMEQEAHTGRIYKRSKGDGFVTYHQASARGERPARDTGNLIDSVEDQKQSPMAHSVYVDDASAPYGKYLQDETVLDRPIFKDEDVEEFRGDQMQVEMSRAAAELTKGVNSVG